MKQMIRLTESDLHRIVKESVERILNEVDEGKIVNNKPHFKADKCYGRGNNSFAKKGEFAPGYLNMDKDTLALRKHNERAKKYIGNVPPKETDWDYDEDDDAWDDDDSE